MTTAGLSPSCTAAEQPGLFLGIGMGGATGLEASSLDLLVCPQPAVRMTPCLGEHTDEALREFRSKTSKPST